MKTNVCGRAWGRASLYALLALVVILSLGCAGESSSDSEQEDSQESALSPSPVALHGKLSVSGGKLRDEHGAAVQLAGMSLFWSQWSGSFWNASVVGTLADDWHASVVRAAMGVENGGYLQNPGAEKARVKTVVDAAIAKGIYVIIDWHDHNASQHTNEAKAFFTEMAQTYGQTPNVIFEVWNEPDGEPWSEIKSYAETVIGAIRGAGASNVVVVGTPTWSQDVDAAANNPITSYGNVAYTLHFYAGSHKQWLRDKASYAMSKGLALFVTEWGTCDASGNGGTDLAESQTWIRLPEPEPD
ncbi:MAG: glycoside hydrolase family 5 protein [Minicystis sp.]